MSKETFYDMLDSAEKKGIDIPWDLLLQVITLVFTWLKSKKTGGIT